jgi:hypothetical protein
MKDHSQDSWCSSQDPNQAPIEYKSRELPVDQPIWSDLLKLWEILTYFLMIMNNQCIHMRIVA